MANAIPQLDEQKLYRVVAALAFAFQNGRRLPLRLLANGKEYTYRGTFSPHAFMLTENYSIYLQTTSQFAETGTLYCRYGDTYTMQMTLSANTVQKALSDRDNHQVYSIQLSGSYVTLSTDKGSIQYQIYPG